jgi:electron transfer flavoprotein beta subunit
MRLKDQQPETKITIVSMGPESARDAIKHSLAMGADEGLLLHDALFEDLDWYQISLALSTAIKKLEGVDLVICGRQAVDWDMGVTGSGIAELLGWPALTIGKDVQVKDGTIVVERVLMDGFETVEAALPAVVTISNELGEPRYPKLQQIMQAARKQVTVWSAADLGLDASQLGGEARKLTLEKLYVPVTDAQCEFIDGDTPEQKAQGLAKKLAEAKLI